MNGDVLQQVTDIQVGAAGCNTGNGEKLSSTPSNPSKAVCLAVA